MKLTENQYHDLLDCDYHMWPERDIHFGRVCPCRSCCDLSEEARAFRNYIAIKRGWPYDPTWVSEIKDIKLKNYLLGAICLRVIK